MKIAPMEVSLRYQEGSGCSAYAWIQEGSQEGVIWEDPYEILGASCIERGVCICRASHDEEYETA